MVKSLYFVLRKSSNDQYYFVIKSNNHEVVATSETWFSKESAMEIINSIKNELNKATCIVIDMTEQGD